MEPIHIFHKELSVDENNIFTADITQKNEIENLRFKKSTEYAVTGLSINQDINSNVVAVTDTDRQKVLSNLILNLVKEKKEPNFDIKIYNTETSEVIILFSKKKEASDISPIKMTFYKTTTKKPEKC